MYHCNLFIVFNLQCLCILNHVWGLMECIYRLSYTLVLRPDEESIRSNPSLVYDLATELSISLSICTFTYTIWIKRKQIFNCYTSLAKISRKTTETKKLWNKVLIISILTDEYIILQLKLHVIYIGKFHKCSTLHNVPH